MLFCTIHTEQDKNMITGYIKNTFPGYKYVYINTVFCIPANSTFCHQIIFK